MTDDLYNELKELLRRNQLEEVLILLSNHFPNNQNLEAFHARLNFVKQKAIKGELTMEGEAVLLNAIRGDILQFIEGNRMPSHRVLPSFLVSIIYLLFNTAFPIVGIAIVSYIIYIIVFVAPPITINSHPPQLIDSSENAKRLSFDLRQDKSKAYILEKNIIGFDKQGKRADYIVFIVKNFNWALGQDSVSERNGKVSSICIHLREIGVEQRVNRDDIIGIVCFGNTSYEENTTLPIKLRNWYEENRADFRSRFLASCVSNVLKTKTPVFTGNLGRYKEKDLISDYQREIMVIGILYNEEGVVNEQALFNGLLKYYNEYNWKVDIRKYSNVRNDSVLITPYLN